jgi:hypothetical protein
MATQRRSLRLYHCFDWFRIAQSHCQPLLAPGQCDYQRAVIFFRADTSQVVAMAGEEALSQTLSYCVQSVRGRLQAGCFSHQPHSRRSVRRPPCDVWHMPLLQCTR